MGEAVSMTLYISKEREKLLFEYVSGARPGQGEGDSVTHHAQYKRLR